MNKELNEIVKIIYLELNKRLKRKVIRNHIIAATAMYPMSDKSFLDYISNIIPKSVEIPIFVPITSWLREFLYNVSFYNFMKIQNNQLRWVYATNNDFNMEKIDPLMTSALQSAVEMVKYPTIRNISEHYDIVSNQIEKFFNMISFAGKFDYIESVDLKTILDEDVSNAVSELGLSDVKLPLYVLYDNHQYAYYIPGIDKIPKHMRSALLLEVIGNSKNKKVKQWLRYINSIEEFEKLYRLNSYDVDVNKDLPLELAEKIEHVNHQISKLNKFYDTELNKKYLYTLYDKSNIWEIVANFIIKLITKGKDVIIGLYIVNIDESGKSVIRHANTVVFIVNDNKIELELFEPTGIVGTPSINKLSQKLLNFVKSRVIRGTRYTLQSHMTPLNKLPFGIVGPQEYTQDKMCVMWTIYYSLLRILHHNVKRDEVKAMTLGVLSESYIDNKNSIENDLDVQQWKNSKQQFRKYLGIKYRVLNEFEMSILIHRFMLMIMTILSSKNSYEVRKNIIQFVDDQKKIVNMAEFLRHRRNIETFTDSQVDETNSSGIDDE